MNSRNKHHLAVAGLFYIMNPLNNTKPKYFEDDQLHESDESSDFFSPISLSFFQPNGRSNNSTSEPGSLPRLHDTSWIGARLSPIRSFDNDDDEHSNSSVDDEENGYHKSSIKVALQYDDPTLSKRNLSNNHYLHHQYPSEHSTLLQPPPNIRSTATSFHPRYTAEIPLSTTSSWLFPSRIRLKGFGVRICSLSLVHLIIMLYCSWRSGHSAAEVETTERPWYSIFFPYVWWRPNDDTLMRLGAFSSSSIIMSQSYWRMATAIFMSTSMGEWTIVCFVWSFVLSSTQQQEQKRKLSRSLQYSQTQIFVIYLTSVVTGELWTLAWDDSAIVRYTIRGEEDGRSGALTGCISWGTCGVLCATGILQPHRRLALFSCAILLTAGAWFQQPYNCLLGTLGGSYFGWGLAAANVIGNKYQAPRESSEIMQRKREWWSATFAIFIWVFPLMWIALS